MRGGAAGGILRRKTQQQMQGAVGGEHAERASEGGEQQAFGERLLHERRATGTEGDANGISEVRAGNQHDHADGGEEKDKCRFGFSEQAVLQGSELDAETEIRVREMVCDLRGNGSKIRLSGGERGSGAQQKLKAAGMTPTTVYSSDSGRPSRRTIFTTTCGSAPKRLTHS